MLNILMTLSEIAFPVAVLALIVALIFSKTRKGVSEFLRWCSWLWAATLWLWCVQAMLLLWGGLPVLIGTVLGFVTVIPIAMVGFATTQRWEYLIHSSFFTALVIFGKVTSNWIKRKAFSELDNSSI